MAAPKNVANPTGFKPLNADPNSIKLPTDQINKPTVLFWIARSKNKNIVVYEADKTPLSLDHYNNVVGYWLDIDPDYVKKNRQKGVNTDRAPLTYMEKKMCYGYTCTNTVNNKKTKIYQLSLVAVPSIIMDIITDNNGKPHAVVIINGKKCYLRKIYVEAKESWYGIPKVIFVQIFGVQIDNGQLQAAQKNVNK